MRWALPFVLVGAAQASTLQWDHPGADGYKCYKDGTQFSDTTEKQVDVTVPKSGANYTCTAYLGDVESAHSDPLIVPPAPSNITITIVIGN